MTKASGPRMTAFVAAFGIATAFFMLTVFGGSAGFSALVGAALALANFIALRTLVARVVDGALHEKGPVLFLLFFKMGAIMGLVYLVIAKQWVEPIAFTVGLSSLVVGLISSSLTASRVAASQNGSES